MITLGKYNTLRIVKRVDFGLYLAPIPEGSPCSGGAAAPQEGIYDEILLPQRYVTPAMHIGDDIEVFLYLDHDERIVATTERPLATVGEFAYMECAWTNEYGAFLRWGLQKDLFCPFREQKQRMERGNTYYVYVMEDEKTHRLMATAKVERYQKTTGRQRALDFAEVLLRHLYENDGFCPLGDHSPAEAISARFGVSKKAYKQAIGDLYRRRLITIEPDGIHLAQEK
jgi:predicted RNA-binding protein (virulence factor B family)